MVKHSIAGERERAEARVKVLCWKLFFAVEKNSVVEVAELCRNIERLRKDPFDLEFSADRDGSIFDGHIFDLALECGSWDVLASILRDGLSRDHPNAAEIFGAVAQGIDAYPEHPATVRAWTGVLRDVVAPSTMKEALDLLNDTRLFELGPIAQSAWREVANKFIAEHERAELDIEIARASHEAFGVKTTRRRRL